MGALREPVFHIIPSFWIGSEMRGKFAKVRFQLIASTNKSWGWQYFRKREDLSLPSITSKSLRHIVKDIDAGKMPEKVKGSSVRFLMRSKAIDCLKHFSAMPTTTSKEKEKTLVPGVSSMLRTSDKNSPSRGTQSKNQGSIISSLPIVVSLPQCFQRLTQPPGSLLAFA
jgi:hypothetical protein